MRGNLGLGVGLGVGLVLFCMDVSKFDRVAQFVNSGMGRGVHPMRIKNVIIFYWLKATSRFTHRVTLVCDREA